jgi:hypothetical protein
VCPRPSGCSSRNTCHAPDDHNHAHTPLQILGLRDGKPAVIAIEQ